MKDIERQKANAFIERLVSNPALKTFSALQKEEQIIQFLTVNSAQLFPTLSSQAFFPNKEWDQIKYILIQSLNDITNKAVIPDLQAIVSKLDLTFFNFLSRVKFDENETKQVILELLTKILLKKQARRVFTGSFNAVKYGFVRLYVDNLFMIRKYIHFEISKVENLKFGEHEAENMITLVTLLKPFIYYIAPVTAGGRATGNGFVFQNAITVQAAKNLSARVQSIPYQVLKSAMNANTSFAENNRLEATSRLSNVLCAMCRNYKIQVKKDRGADTAIKSWINVARKNYRFYGYDIKLLDELYNIASDNGW